MIILLKAIAVALAIITISKSYLDWRKRIEPTIMFIFWTLVWTTTTILIIYPLLIERITVYLQEGVVAISTITSMAFVFMLFIVYRVYTKAARIEYQLTNLVRKISLDETIESKKKK